MSTDAFDGVLRANSIDSPDDRERSDESETPQTIAGFRVGDRVVDVTEIPARSAAVSVEDSPPFAVVIAVSTERAEDVLVREEKTVADFNPEIAGVEDDPVITVAFIDGNFGLKANLGDRWNDGPPDKIAERIDQFRREWKVSPRTYDYPASRLIRLDKLDIEWANQVTSCSR